MDGDKKCEGEQQDSTQAESCTSETTSEDVAQKRKRTEEEDSEDNQNTKKVKVDDKGEKVASDAEELSKKKAAEGEEDKSMISEEKQAMVEEKEMSSEAKQITSEEKLQIADAKEEKEQEAMSEEKEVKLEEKQIKSEEKISGEEEMGLHDRKEDKAGNEAAQQSKEEAMEVEESMLKTEKTEGLTSDTETSLPDIKSENKAQEELHTEKIKEEKSDPKPEPGSEKKEDKLEVVQRRYPTRSRRTEEKGASHQLQLKASSTVPDEKKGGNPGREDMDGEVARAPSVKSDNGSDKENMNGEMEAREAETPDVILLSEDEETEQGKEKRAKRRKLVRRLQAHLRNEEAKLVLLKKLRQSQLTPQVQDHTSTPTSTTAGHLAKQTLPRQQGGPPPLVRGGQQIRGTNLHMQQQQNRTPSQGQMRNIQGPPPLVVTPRMGSGAANGPSGQLRNNAASHVNQHGSSTLRPTQQQQQQNQQQHQQSGQQQASTPPQPPVDTQTPAQRQAAAKLALRKQLEKTLLQIPPPKPPAPEMNFIPSLACPDFVLLLGLEEVVNHIIDLQLIARGQKSPDEKFICNPFTCVQCGTDYTPVWKREKPGSKNVICEHCVTWNQKRALKQEHTNRLKSAFVKALQQEQEIERMQAQTPSNPSTPTPSGTPPTSSSSAPPQALAAAAAASNVAAAAAMTMSPASFRPSAEQVRQHHSFLQAQAQLRAGQPLAGLQGFGGRPPFYNLPYVKQADLQRQYLLDMIPRAAGMPWKQ